MDSTIITFAFGTLVLFAGFVIYHFVTLNTIEKTHVSIECYPRREWISIIHSLAEPDELRIKLILKMAYDPETSREELEDLAFYLVGNKTENARVFGNARVLEAIEFFQRQLELTRLQEK